MSESEAVSLREHLEKKIELRWQGHQDVHVAEDRARAKAEVNIAQRLETMNEVRQQLDRQAGTFITNDAFSAASKVIEVRISVLERWQSGVEAKFWAIGVGFTILTTALNWYLFH